MTKAQARQCDRASKHVSKQNDCCKSSTAKQKYAQQKQFATCLCVVELQGQQIEGRQCEVLGGESGGRGHNLRRTQQGSPSTRSMATEDGSGSCLLASRCSEIAGQTSCWRACLALAEQLGVMQAKPCQKADYTHIHTPVQGCGAPACKARAWPARSASAPGKEAVALGETNSSEAYSQPAIITTCSKCTSKLFESYATCSQHEARMSDEAHTIAQMQNKQLTTRSLCLCVLGIQQSRLGQHEIRVLPQFQIIAMNNPFVGDIDGPPSHLAPLPAVRHALKGMLAVHGNKKT
eukprot:scaffold12192_cov20-Tisochrysis_lutea.AAC.1